MIGLLVAARANLNARSSDTSDTPLLAAVKAGQPAAVRALIDAGADTSAGELTMTPLEYAVWRANSAVVRELVKGGRTPVNARHAWAKESPPHGALWCRNPDYNIELIQTLISAGANLSAVDQNGDTPLKAAERKRSAEKQPVLSGLLRRAGGVPEIRGCEELTPGPPSVIINPIVAHTRAGRVAPKRI